MTTTPHTELALAEVYAGLVDRSEVQRSLGTGLEVRVGTDVQQVAAVQQALDLHAERYLDRVFTSHEQECVGLPTPGPSVAAGLAARFAAKEAMVKVLRPVDEGIPWRDLEVRRQPGGWCSLELRGVAARLATAAGLVSWSVSFSHDGPAAVATVIALRTGPGGPGLDTGGDDDRG